MGGTSEGGKKSAKTIKQKYGKDYYKKIGSLGGNPGTGGFASDQIGADGLTGKERARHWGSIGGKISKRTKADAA